MHRLALAAAALAALCLASPALAAGVPIRTEKLAKDTEAATMSVEYPVTGNAGVDAEVAAWAKGEFDNFAQLSTEDRQPDEAAYELEITFEVERNDATGFAVLFTEYTFTGGAHPNSDFTTFNYVMPEGWRVYLPEIFQAKALKTISSLAVAALKKDMGGDADSETIADGAGPAWDNFDDFTLKADRLDLNFSAYQVAAYAAGPQFVSIPLSKLKGLMRPDWKAPAPSFDCAKAGTAIEKAICGSVELARLDRGVAEAYARKLKYSFEDGEKAKNQAEQRQWLADRDQKCGNGDAACLKEVYATRLKALTEAGG
ncbi:MAG: DUF3298 domain-containing protein [Rhizobiales bacterium]|nr:DUF3298 domain-containing protein [Hyphomicrobiales bacterium]